MQEKIIFLNSGRCKWGKCLFCGWGKREYPRMGMDELKKKFEGIEKVKRLKVFNSGSFFDEKQIPRDFRKYLIKLCEGKGIKELVVETREEFLTDKNLKDMESEKVKVFFGIGLEAGDDKVLKKLRKGKTVDDYKKACEMLREKGFGSRSYILVNAPFSGKGTLDKSVKLADKYSDEIVLLNTFPHVDSKLFELWLKGKWKPISYKEFMGRIKKYLKNKKIEYDFSNFEFKPRFPKDRQEWIRGASLKELRHPCFEVWQEYFSRFYEVPKGKSNVIFIPCAFRKPYFVSKLHKAIIKVLKRSREFNKLHLVVISSPGVIPYEFANKYPFNKYDWPEWEETKKVKKKYIQVTQRRIEDYLREHKYKKYYCYFKPSSESYKALVKACKRMGIKLVDVLSEKSWKQIKGMKNPLSLEEGLEDMKKIFS